MWFLFPAVGGQTVAQQTEDLIVSVAELQQSRQSMLSQGSSICEGQQPGGKSQDPKYGMGISRWKHLKIFAPPYTLDSLGLQRWTKLLQ